MKKGRVLVRAKKDCLVVAIRVKNYEQGGKVVDVIIEGSTDFIELTITVDEGGPVGFIKMVANKYKSGDRTIIGASTVLDPETAGAYILIGADCIVSPGLNADATKLYSRYKVPMLSSVMAPAEVVTVLEAGCDIIKVFPDNIVRSVAISSFRGPLPQSEFMPLSGADVDNIDEWIKTGAYIVGADSSLAKGAKTGDFAAVTAKTQEFVAAVTAAGA